MSGNGEHNLRSGVLGLFDSVIMGVAGSAPAYSIAATTTALFGTVLYAGPAALLYCGIPMFGIVFAFNYLSKADQHAGASYSWVRRAMHPILGFLSGWAMVVSALIFMVIATFPAGSSVLSLFSNGLAANKTWVTVFGAFFFLLMVGAVAAGVTVTVQVQIVMSCLEVALLLLFAVLAIVHGHHVVPFSWHWFSFSAFSDKGSAGFAAGALLAAFYYWGWDVTSNLNEETKDAHKTSGAGGLIGALIVFLLFEVFTVATNLVLTPAQMNNSDNAADILAVLGQAVWPGWGGKLIVVAVLLSTVATLETTLIQVTRTLFAMGRDVTIPSQFGKVHPIRQTPLFATVFVAIASIILYVGSNYVGGIATVLQDGYAAIGIQICFYYCMAGLAVVILYRRQLLKSVGNFVLIGVWPLGGAIFMGWVLLNVLPELNSTTLLVGLGSMVLGLIPLAYYWSKGSAYFTMPTKEDRHAVLEEFEQNL